MDGAEVLGAAQELVLDVLRTAPEGLTNSEVGQKTGLNLPIKGHNDYITWTVLQYLLQNGRIEKVGRRYTIKS